MILYLHILTGALWTTLTAAEVGLHQYLENNLNHFVDRLEDNSPEAEKSLLEWSFYHTSRFSEVSEDVPNVHIYTLFNKTFVTMEDEIFMATSNKSLKMELVGNLDHANHATYLKVIEYKGTGYMALSTTNEVTFYEITNSTPSFLHSISRSKSSAGSFFVNQENMYFLSGTNKGQCESSLKVYKWLGSHFDGTHSIIVPSINIINTFQYNGFEIIILCHLDAISVYLFNQESLRKIQHLDGEIATHLDLFVQDGIPYMLTYQLGKQNLYRWAGFEMVLVNTFNWDHFGKSLVVYMNSTPYIVQPKLDHLLVLKPKGKQIIWHKEKRFFNKFLTVLGIDKGQNSKGNITFIVGLNDDNIINIYSMSFEADAGIEAEQDGMLSTCFDNLETKLNERKKKSNIVTTKHLEKRQVHQEDTNIQNKWKNIVNSLNELKLVLSLKGNVSQFAVNNNVVIQNITLKTATAKQWKCNFLNGKTWTPVSWLGLNGTQVVHNFVKIHTLKTRNLRYIHNNTILNKMLTKHAINTLENLQVNKLVVPKVYTETINNIEVSTIAKTSSSLPLRGLKTFKNITTLSAQIENLNGIKVTNQIDFLKFYSHVTVESIEVNSVNGINWNEFKNQTFKIDEDTNIIGNITIPKLKTITLKSPLLNNVPVSNLLTVATKQNVTPTLIFNHIQAKSISCDTLNEVEISNIVQLDQDTSVKGKVVVENLFVRTHLETLSGKNYNISNNSLEMFLGKQVITSNLHAKNFLVGSMAKLNISGELYTFENLSNYWSKNENQSIPVHFEALEGMSVQHLQTFSLNEVPVGIYATNNPNTTITSPLFLENATVIGNVTIENNETKSFLEKLHSEGVRKHGFEYIIKGKKIFHDKLTANHLETFEFEEIYQKENLSRDQVYTSIVVKGNFSGIIETETINNISSLANQTSWNKPQNLTNLSLKNVTVKNLHIKSIHGIKVEDYLKKLDYIQKSKHLENVMVTGNLTVFKIEELKTINTFDVVNLLNEDTFDFKGGVKFAGNVYVNYLKTKVINDIDFPLLTSKCFHKKFTQTVTGRFTFNDLKTEHLHTKSINEVNVANLIDTSDTFQTISSGVILNNSVFSSLKASKMEPCNIYQAMESILSPQTREWPEVEIIGNVTIIDTNSDIKKILENTVRPTKSNTISAPVFIAGDIRSQKVDLQGKLNKVVLKELIEDVVIVDAEHEQFITGPKTFANKLFANLVIVKENADVYAVNDMEVRELYEKIISNEKINDLVILGKKTFFAGLQTDKFMTNRISGLLPDDVVTLSNSTFTVPEVIFDSLNITNSLTIKDINNYDLNTVLNNRLLLNVTERQVTNALHFLSTVNIEDKLQVAAINNIQIKNVVFDLDQQEITEPKHFMQELTINGNLSMNSYNWIAVPTVFNNSVSRSSSTVISTLSILKSTEFTGTLTASKINNFPLEYVNSALQISKIQEGKISEIIDEAQNVIQLSSSQLQPWGDEFMYIQNTENFQVKNNKAVDVKITVIQNYTLVHITSEETHDKCLLPIGCECLVQHSLEISPDLSVNPLPQELPHQRVFSFNNEHVTVHVLINSVSKSQECRLNNTDDTVYITWNVKGNLTKNNYIFPLSVTDYISDVGFFTMNETTYLMITRFYDPLLDTHQLNSTLYKLSYDKEYVFEVQNIPSYKASSLHLMESAQGIILVIANQAETPFTNIFKFDQNNEKFELLRIWPYGCTKAQGIVLAADSFLILASNDEPLWVLKYHHKWNNYYAYQKIIFDETVVSLSSFYLQGFSTREAFLSVVTQDSYYHIYKFYYTDGWVLEFEGIRTGLKGLVPFELDNQLYLFAPSISEYLFLRVVTR